ncbi:hypothetical protein [Streptomyces mirabilis]|uniref:hypothetical protein n=1 Tax=Streptomyces mirabilis TaxID=68239 RepID=UPI0034371C58
MPEWRRRTESPQLTNKKATPPGHRPANRPGTVELLGLDGHLDLVGDPFSGAVIDRGRIVLPGDPGLGACSRPDSENTWEK